MAAKQIAYQMEAREAIRRGVKQLARAVKATLGPCGRNVVIEKSFGSPTVTKDGVIFSFDVFTRSNLTVVPVVEKAEHRRIVGLVEQRDLLRALHRFGP